MSGWYGPADRHDLLWAIVAVVLGMAGMAVLIGGQTPIYHLGLWGMTTMGGWR